MLHRTLLPTTILGLTVSGLVGSPALAAADLPGSAQVATSPAATAAAAAPGRKFVVRTSGQLRRAVNAANRRSGKDRIELKRNISLAGGQLTVRGKLVVIGNGRVINARNRSRIFEMPARGRLVLRNVRLRNGKAPVGLSGGAIAHAGTVKLVNSRIEDSVARGVGASGGAVFNDGGTLRVKDTKLLNNRATRAGGAIEALGGKTIISGSRMSRNRTGAQPGNGGAVHLTGDGVVRVTNSRVTNNSAAAEGGGLWNSDSGTMNVTKSLVKNNVARGGAPDNGGAGLFNDGGDLRVFNTRVITNRATKGAGSGGGILSDGGDLRVVDSTVGQNRAKRAGGGIEVVGGTTRIRGTKVNNNRVGPNPGNGGGLHVTGPGNVEINASSFRKNIATAEGGGIWNSADGEMFVLSTTVGQNDAGGAAADQGGGGVFNDGGDFASTNLNAVGNRATGTSGSGGGLLNVNGGIIELDDATFLRNRAQRAGGGIESAGGFLLIERTNMVENLVGAAPGNGGAIHTTGTTTVDFQVGAIAGNSAANEGGGFWHSGSGPFTASDINFRDNAAPTGVDTFNNGEGVGPMLVNGLPVLPTF